MRKSKTILGLTCLLIFFASLAVSYWPVYHKGYVWSFSADEMILARNFGLTGEYKIDNEKNITLSSEVVKQQGIKSELGNKLTPILYGYIFKFFGFFPWLPLAVCLTIYAVINVLFFLLINKRFSFRLGALFSLLAVFSPFILQNTSRFGTYEWAMLFLTVGLVFYFWRERPSWKNLLVTGIFLGLATLARNSFLILPFAFAVYELWQVKSWKRAIVLALPLVIFWGIYLGPGLLSEEGMNNTYISGAEERTTAYMHIFPDPYTWHYERDVYAQTLIGSTDYGVSEFLLKYGYPVSAKNKITMYLASVWSYPTGFLSEKNSGGPFILFLLILGIFYLWKQDKKLIWLFSLWSGLLYIFLIINTGNHFGHMMPLEFPFFLLTAFGILALINFIEKQVWPGKIKKLLIFGFLMAFVLQLIQADQEMFHEKYLYSGARQSYNIISQVQKSAGNLNKKTDTIAVGAQNPSTSIINYYTDLNTIYFAPTTVQRLLQENKLEWAFEQFGITKIVGYSEDLSREIVPKTGLSALGSEGLD